jgi:hypothetical protein
MWRNRMAQRHEGAPLLAPPQVARGREQLRFLLDYGVLAPAAGAHGPAPWQLRMRGDAVDLHLAHHCALDAHDPAHRDLVIACGATLAQLRLAARQLGFRESTVIFPDPWQPELLARVHLDEAGPATPEAYVLYQALCGPVLVDDGSAMQSIDAALLAELKALCAEEQVQLHYVDRSLVGSGSPSSSPQPETEPDDMRGLCEAPTITETIALLHAFQLRTFRPETATWSADCELALSAAVPALVTTAQDGAGDWLAAGQAIARAFLRARVDGVYASVHGLASPSLRAQIARDLGPSDAPQTPQNPQLVVRFGYPRTSKLVRHETRMFEAVRPSPPPRLLRHLLGAPK